jgi:GNAT superfamily N-acetyltransferase
MTRHSQSTAVRAARPDDAPVIVELIRRLARFEGCPDAVRLTEAVVRRDAFGPDARLIVLLGEMDGVACAILTLIETYSSWAGAPAMTVHDLFVGDEARGLGLGRRLLAEAAVLARTRRACRLDVNVLDWNMDAIAFYRRLGFAPMTGWQPYRLAADDLARLAGTP